MTYIFGRPDSFSTNVACRTHSTSKLICSEERVPFEIANISKKYPLNEEASERVRDSLLLWSGSRCSSKNPESISFSMATSASDNCRTEDRERERVKKSNHVMSLYAEIPDRID